MTVDETPPARPQRRPEYRVPMPTLIAISISVLLGRRRSFVPDAIGVMRANRNRPRRVEGIDNIPRQGPFIVVMNHLSRQVLSIVTGAIKSAEAAAKMRTNSAIKHWAFTSE